jgi:hypothetical protein
MARRDVHVTIANNKYNPAPVKSATPKPICMERTTAATDPNTANAPFNAQSNATD